MAHLERRAMLVANPNAERRMLSAKEIQNEVLTRVKKYEGRSFLERFALFMGVAQVVEIGLKQLLHRRYGVEFEKLERSTLGQVARLLKHQGLRPDFAALLDSVVGHRNHIAHSLLVNQFILTDLGVGKARFETRELDRGIYELEQLWFLYEWTEEHDAWGEDVA